MRFTLLFVILTTLWFSLSGQSTDSLEKEGEELFSEFSLLPLPVVAARPALGFMYGLAPSASWLMGSSQTTHRSLMVSSIFYTTKKQFLVFLKSNIYLRDDSWNLIGDWRYFDTSQPTFGLGTGPQSAHLTTDGLEYEDGKFTQQVDAGQRMDFNYFRFSESVLKRIGNSRFFAGFGYRLDHHYNINDGLLDLDTVPPVLTSHFIYSVSRGFSQDGYTLSGISLNAIYDDRDNAINPYDGKYAFISFQINPAFLGSDQQSTSLWLEYRDYFTILEKRPRHLVGIWAYGNFETSGSIPYLDLPAIAWDQFGRSGRGYAQGRFRGQGLVYAEAEYRCPLQREKDTFGFVVFVNATTASYDDDGIALFEYIDPAIGVGLRIMINKNSRTNLTFDYAWGRYGSHGFYLNVNEAF